MLVVCRYRMREYYSEKYVILIDLNHMNIASIPMSKIYTCLRKLSLYSCGFTDHNFVLNSKGIWPVWTLVKSVLP